MSASNIDAIGHAAAVENERAVGSKTGRVDKDSDDYVTAGSIAARVRRHLDSIAPAAAEDDAAAAPSEFDSGVAMRRFVSMFAVEQQQQEATAASTAAPATTATHAETTEANAPAAPGAVDSSAGRDLVLEAKDIERLLATVGFEPAHKMSIAVNLLLTKCTPAQRNVNNARKGKGKAPRGSKATVSELTWIFTQQQDPSAKAAAASSAAGGGNTGHTKARRVEPGTPQFLEFVKETPLMANLRRQFIDVSEEQRALGQQPMPLDEFAALEASLTKPLGMSLRLHRGDTSLQTLGRILLGACEGGKALVPSEVFANAGATVEMRAMSDADYHDPLNVATYDLCRNGHSAGSWSFQESVSMLPVAALGVEPHHRVLDMCAAPGSKSLQVLDALLRDGQAAATGVLICNEKEHVKARQTLPARLKRSHCPNAVVMRGDGTALPAMIRQFPAGGGPPEQLRFDRIVCDVPCSGDGTARKDSSVWSGWSRDYGESLTKTQRALLLRSIDLLKVGGIVAYSTCSMHVAEDEEVVARALDCYGEDIELLDANEELRKRGIVLHSSGGLPCPFPDSRRTVENDEGGAAWRRERHTTIKDKVLRVLPHRDDTGGFFVALIRRVKPPIQIDISNKLNQWNNGKRFVRVDNDPADTAAFDGILASFGTDRQTLDEVTGGAVPTWLVTPSGAKKKLFLLSPGASEIVHNCVLRKGAGAELVACGIRAFAALDTNFLPDSVARYRMAGEMAALLGPVLNPKVRRLDVEDSAVVRELLFYSCVSTPLLQIPPHLLDGDRVRIGPVVIAVRVPEAKRRAAALECERDGWIWMTGILTGNKLDHTLDASMVRAIGEHVFGFSMPAKPGPAAAAVDKDDADGGA